MKGIIWCILILILTINCAFSQKVEFVKGRNYKGFIFPKDFKIWGLPAQKDRYTLNADEIAKAEKILRDSISTDFVKSHQNQYKNTPINRRTLRKYLRQYVGYKESNGDIIVDFHLHREMDDKIQHFSKDLIHVLDGGSDH